MMKNQRAISLLVLCIVIFSSVAAATGIFSNEGPGPYEYQSIRGETITIYGKGIYQHMSAELAPQGIAQDVVTLFLGIPLLILSLHLTRKGSLKGRFLLAGTSGYFLVTYLFYMAMGMYNNLFLVYVALMCTSFFTFILTLLSFDLGNLKTYFSSNTPVKFVGGFLVFQTIMIALLWLGRVVPPLIEGTVPLGLEHYTTLIVQGMDLGILLPSALLAGVLLIKRSPFGYLLGTVYINFLVILMTALTAKVIGQMILGVDVGVPVIIIIPFFNLTTILCSFLMLRNINKKGHSKINTSYSV